MLQLLYGPIAFSMSDTYSQNLVPR